MGRAGGRVQFDFEGSLALARELWAFADEVDTERATRESNFDIASASWRGSYADEFGKRRETERASERAVVVALREDAEAWAKAWAAAMDQQNKNNRVAEVERRSRDRNLLEKAWDSTFGEDDSEQSVPMPAPVPVPTAPAFRPTACEVTY